ncbi:MAG TPA: hypothetical protein DD723_04565 [Candidatus Omnitrophica bacterium]|nr:MAG: hypothetical protein A2Z81_04065 [Omnitrophica WOR_2 bacterium GWA2_45_18]HBR14802.1 hypothetical protein [Candidatus Omnitrophota bacterium]
MKLKEHLKQFNRSLGRYALVSTRWIISKLPYAAFRLFSSVFIAVGRPFIKKKQRLAMESLHIAFGKEKDEAEIRKIASACFNNFGRGMIDLIYFIDRPRKISECVSIEGKEHLDKALAAGNGAILVSAHFGNFILMYMGILQAGYKTNVIMRRTRDQTFESYISGFRNEQGLKTIYDLPPRQCVQQSIKALRHNEVLFILLDQNYGTDGRVFVDFFGQKAATASGPVVFSKRTQSPILPVFIMREGGDRHKITIDPPVPLEKGRDEQEEILLNVAKLTQLIEARIRQHPHEWGGWMHKRWKSRTRAEQIIIDRMNEVRKRKEKIKKGRWIKTLRRKGILKRKKTRQRAAS